MARAQGHEMLREVLPAPEAARVWGDMNNVYEVKNKAQKHAHRAKEQKKEYKQWKKGSEFVMQNHKVEAMYGEMNHAEAGTFFKLFCHVKWGDNTLSTGDKTMKVSEMSRIVGVGEKTLKRHMAKLIELNLIIKEGDRRWTTYSINPLYVQMGKKESKEAFTRVYKTSARFFFNELSLKELGFFIKLSLKISMTSLYVVNNPHEIDSKNQSPMNIHSIAEYMGDDMKTVKRYIKALGDARILKEIGNAGSSYDKKKYFLHPHVVDRGEVGSDSYFDALREFTSISDMENDKMLKQSKAFMDRIKK